MDVSNFCGWLKNKMDEKGWSQSELGRRSGISQAQVGRLLLGARQPGIKACKSLANALDCSVYDVYRAAGLFNLADEQYEPTRFRDWLLEQIAERNWNQATLANAAGLDRAVISNLISMRRQPGEATCSRIAAALGFPPETVFRIANLLPTITDEAEGILEEWRELLLRLSTENREELRQIGELKLRRQKNRV